MILALDLATTTGWAKQLESGRIVFGTIDCKPNPKDDYAAKRLRLFRAGLADVLTDDVTSIVFEDVQFHTSGAQSRWWGAWWALTLLAGDAREIPCHGVPVSTLKRWATGSGAAPKRTMQLAALRLLDHYGPQGHTEVTSDEGDAICLLGFALEQSRSELRMEAVCAEQR